MWVLYPASTCLLEANEKAWNWVEDSAAGYGEGYVRSNFEGQEEVTVKEQLQFNILAEIKKRKWT